jgi:hypothetical protein
MSKRYELQRELTCVIDVLQVSLSQENFSSTFANSLLYLSRILEIMTRGVVVKVGVILISLTLIPSRATPDGEVSKLKD